MLGCTTGAPGDFDLINIYLELPGNACGRTARRIRDYLGANKDEDPLEIHIEGVETVLVIPRAGAALLATAFSILADGGGVALVPSQAQLTTQQAAEMLNVSRPYLIGLLDSGAIRHTKVGRHRRVAFADVTEYKRHMERETRQAADELSELGQEIGL
jgi:excisionase family DNA binding protein